MSVVPSSVEAVDEILRASVVLAALELVPGDPSDLTSVLRDPADRQALLGSDAERNPSCDMRVPSEWSSSSARSPLGRYLVEQLDRNRVAVWLKLLTHQARERRYRPIVFGWQEYPARLGNVLDAPPILFRGEAGNESDRDG